MIDCSNKESSTSPVSKSSSNPSQVHDSQSSSKRKTSNGHIGVLPENASVTDHENCPNVNKSIDNRNNNAKIMPKKSSPVMNKSSSSDLTETVSSKGVQGSSLSSVPKVKTKPTVLKQSVNMKQIIVKKSISSKSPVANVLASRVSSTSTATSTSLSDSLVSSSSNMVPQNHPLILNTATKNTAVKRVTPLIKPASENKLVSATSQPRKIAPKTSTTTSKESVNSTSNDISSSKAVECVNFTRESNDKLKPKIASDRNGEFHRKHPGRPPGSLNGKVVSFFSLLLFLLK